MKILSCCPLSYYGEQHGITLSYDLFVRVPRLLGHHVVPFDYLFAAKLDKDAMNDHFLSLIKGGNFDFVIIETADDQFYIDVLEKARKIVPIIAWNSDDDFRWSSYSEKQYSLYSMMFTTSEKIYEIAKKNYPNLRYSQWGCTGFSCSSNTLKDIDVSFCGALKRERVIELRALNEKGMKIYVRGKGSEQLGSSIKELEKIAFRRIRRGKNSGFRKELSRWIVARAGGSSNALSYEELHTIWNHSKIIYTPLKLEKSQQDMKRKQFETLGITYTDDDKYQCKSRIFEQGLSGAMMLLDRNLFLKEYYVVGEEYEDYSSKEECIEKIYYYLKNPKARQKLAANYTKKTVAKHLWKNRFVSIVNEITRIL